MKRKHNLGKFYLLPLILSLIVSAGTVFSTASSASVSAADEVEETIAVSKETETADSIDENQNRGG